MKRKRGYFRHREGDPEPLVAECSRRVRFEEVDMLGMVWHGRYPSFLEDGRMAFGDKFGMTYQNFMVEGTVAPIVQMKLDYKKPLRFGETMLIKTSLHWNEAARIDFSYRIVAEDGKLAASGCTVQLLTDPDGTMLLSPPDWLIRFRQQWFEGGWK